MPKFIINDIIYDSKVTPVAIVFEDDKSKQRVIDHLNNMETKEGVRIYAIMPDDMPDKEGYFKRVVEKIGA